MSTPDTPPRRPRASADPATPSRSSQEPAEPSAADLSPSSQPATEPQSGVADVPAFAVCVVVPAFNEASTIAEVVRGARGCAGVTGVTVVDDGSTDGTGARAAAAGAEVLRHAENRGKGHAIRTGLAYALERPVTHVLLMDGDLQHRPADIPTLFDAARTRDVDLVVGERVFDKRSMPTSRYYSNVIGSRALSAFIGCSIRDSQSGFRLLRRDILRDLHLTATGYEVETEMLIKLARRGVRMTSVPVELSYGAKSKLRPIRDTTRTCFLAVYYRFLSRE